MILPLLVAILLVAAVFAWISGRWSSAWPRWISVFALAIDLLVVTIGWFAGSGDASNGGRWIQQFRWPWIPQLGIEVHLAADALSLILVALTLVVGLMATASAAGQRDRVGLLHFHLLLTLAGIVGIFLAMDLLLLYLCWEVNLVPMFFLIALWGHEDRFYASIKFFLFTQLSGLLMLLATLALYFAHGQQTGTYTFNYEALLNTSLSPGQAMLLLLGFMASFAVKLPVVPLHTWLPDAHTEAPTAGSVVLAGLLLKTGAYGMIRFAIPLFYTAAIAITPVMIVLSVVGILYGALLALGQSDLKRLVAYTSISHMGFVLLGIFTWNQLALQGVLLEIVCHAFSTGGLFVLAGMLQERLRTRDIGRMGGLWKVAPRMGGMATVLALASLGLPGLGNFLAEILILLGAYQRNPLWAAAATLGFIVATVYSLWIIQRVFHGQARPGHQIADVTKREFGILAASVGLLIWLGLYPSPLTRAAAPALERVQTTANTDSIRPRPAGGQNTPSTCLPLVPVTSLEGQP